MGFLGDILADARRPWNGAPLGLAPSEEGAWEPAPGVTAPQPISASPTSTGARAVSPLGTAPAPAEGGQAKGEWSIAAEPSLMSEVAPTFSRALPGPEAAARSGAGDLSVAPASRAEAAPGQAVLGAHPPAGAVAPSGAAEPQPPAAGPIEAARTAAQGDSPAAPQPPVGRRGGQLAEGPGPLPAPARPASPRKEALPPRRDDGPDPAAARDPQGPAASAPLPGTPVGVALAHPAPPLRWQGQAPRALAPGRARPSAAGTDEGATGVPQGSQAPASYSPRSQRGDSSPAGAAPQVREANGEETVPPPTGEGRPETALARSEARSAAAALPRPIRAAAPPPAPEVRIGQIDIVVEAPAAPAVAAGPAPAGDLLGRHYLRGP